MSQELFKALEFAHYAERFRNKLFVVALPHATPFLELLPDLKVLAGYHIRVVLVAPDNSQQLPDLLERANKRGSRFFYQRADGQDPAKLKAALKEGLTPVVGFVDPQPPAPHRHEPEASHRLAAGLAEQLGAHKLFVVVGSIRQVQRIFPHTHVNVARLAAWLQAGGPDSPRRRLLAFVRQLLERGVPDVVLIEGRSPSLFREVFTYDGSGILFNAERQSAIRKAQVADVTDIMMFLRPEVDSGRILPVEENRVEAEIGHYWIYEIEGDMVGLARLKHHQGADGEAWAELSQFTTLPRYRGRGRAQELALKMMEEAARMGIRKVFALSIDERMWRFFQELGLEPTPREALPPGWQKGYDFSRPSKAFSKTL